MRWWDKPTPVDQIVWMAQMALLNDATTSVYTMKLNKRGEWVEDRHFVNPDLVLKRAILGIANSAMAARDKIQSELFPALIEVGEAFKRIENNFK
jgi:hypothetical protein